MATRGTRRAIAIVVIVGMVVSLGLAGVASFYASGAPDGLERVAEDTGFADQAQDSATAGSLVADYSVGDDDGRFSVGTAGLVGVGITAAAGFGLFALLRPRARRD